MSACKNYRDLLSDERVWSELRHHRQVRDRLGRRARCWSASASRFCSTAHFRFKGLVTTLLLLPMMMSAAVVGLFWQLLYSPTWGPINYIFGLGDFGLAVQCRHRALRGRDHRHLDVVAVRDAACRSPASSAVPKHLYEAAAIDRAGAWYTFTRITLPLVAPLLLIALIFRTMEAFKTFDSPMC